MSDAKTNDVVIYTKDYCGYCAGAKALLGQKGAQFREIDVTHDSDLQAEMTKRSGRRTVPLWRTIPSRSRVARCDRTVLAVI